MKSLALLSLLSIACTGLMGCHFHDDDDREHHDHVRVDRDSDHVVREERTVIVPERHEEVRIER